jgi:hypothetical protein
MFTVLYRTYRYGECQMSSTKRQGAFGSRNTPENVPRYKKVQEVESADEHIVLVLTNLHDSLKWVFTVLMGGSVYFAASTLFSIQARTDFPPAEPTFLFVLFSLTFGDGLAILTLGTSRSQDSSYRSAKSLSLAGDKGLTSRQSKPRLGV